MNPQDLGLSYRWQRQIPSASFIFFFFLFSITLIWGHCSKFTSETSISLRTGLVVHMDFVQVQVSDELHVYLTFRYKYLYLKSYTVDTTGQLCFSKEPKSRAKKNVTNSTVKVLRSSHPPLSHSHDSSWNYEVLFFFVWILWSTDQLRNGSIFLATYTCVNDTVRSNVIYSAANFKVQLRYTNKVIFVTYASRMNFSWRHFAALKVFDFCAGDHHSFCVSSYYWFQFENVHLSHCLCQHTSIIYTGCSNQCKCLNWI